MEGDLPRETLARVHVGICVWFCVHDAIRALSELQYFPFFTSWACVIQPHLLAHKSMQTAMRLFKMQGSDMQFFPQLPPSWVNQGWFGV